MSYIEVRDLKKEYKTGKIKFEALKGIDMDIKSGEVLSILGPSGCGKSTLLNCLSGIDNPTCGKVVIGGTDIHSLKDDNMTYFRAVNMGFIFQFYNLIPVLNVIENVELAMLSSGKSEKEARNAAKSVLERVGLSDRVNYYPSNLSGGERQRVSIARALVHTPKIIWADEPTGALDTETGKKIMELIIKLNEEYNQTFVIVTHDERISNYSDRILKMDSGRIIETISLQREKNSEIDFERK